MLKPRKILLADNVASFRESCAEFLAFRGYTVVQVGSPEECWQAVEADPPHLAVLDMRMRNDFDDADWSGLQLAKTLPAQLPKIILTAFPTWKMAREALTARKEGVPPATFLISKLEGLAVLETYVARAFTEHVRLNWDLQVNWEPAARAALADRLEPALPESLQQTRAAELEDLLCRLFLNLGQISFDRLLWQDAGLAALQVLVPASGQAATPLLVVCGLRDAVQQEAATYQALAQQMAPTARLLPQAELAETVHYAANAYTLASARERAASLRELYEAGPAAAVAGLRLDAINQLAWVDGRLLKLTAREFQLLAFLYERRNQLCTRQQLIEEFFAYRYDRLDDSQEALVNTNISRLRAELETDPQNPRYLQTVRGRGYRLEAAG